MAHKKSEADARPEILHQNLVDYLGRRIVNGTLAAGTVLTLQGICENLDVSRTVAREGIRVLENMGLVTSRRRIGITVAPFENWKVLDPTLMMWRLDDDETRAHQLLTFMELRQALEPAAASLAARNASERQQRRLQEIASDMVRLAKKGKGATPEFLALDVEYHELLLRAGGNEMFAAISEVIRAVLIGRTHWGLQPEFPDMEAMGCHLRLADAVATRDEVAAHAASYRLVEIAIIELGDLETQVRG